MAKTNEAYLRELLTTDEKNEFLDGLISEHDTKVAELNDEIDDLKGQVDELEKKVDTLSGNQFDGETITTPIGSIKYETTGSLDLVQLMEAFGKLVQDQGPTEMLRHL